MVEIEGDPWFLLKDVAETIGLKPHSKGGHHHHLLYLGSEEVSHSSELGVTLPGSGMYHAKWISESGLYKLVMRSDKPEARRFQDWVTKEVLPSIRKTGAYVVGQAQEGFTAKLSGVSLARAGAATPRCPLRPLRSLAYGCHSSTHNLAHSFPGLRWLSLAGHLMNA